MCPTLQPAPHVKARSGGVTLTERRTLRRRRHRDVTKGRTLGGRRHGKAHFACGPHQKAHSACERSRRVRLSVRARAQNALFRRLRFSSPAQTWSHLTQRRILCRPPYGKPHSVPGNSRKSTLCTGDATSTWPKGAFWAGDVTEKRTLRVGLTKRRILHASGGCAESPSSPICVHSCIPTATRATGRGHGSHDIDGPMALVMPERSDLRPTPPGR